MGLKEEQTALAVRAQAGDRRALAELMASMQGYIVSTRRRYAARGLDTDDIEQACRVGILRALRTFDPARGSFPSAASAWIREEIRLHSDTMLRPLKVPTSRPLRLVQWKVLPEMRRLQATGAGYEESLVQACEAAGVSPTEARTFLASLGTVQIGTSQDREAGDVHEPQETPDPTSGIEGRDRAWALEIVRTALTEREWDIMRMRVFEGASWASMAPVFGMTRERVGQIAQEAFKKAALALEYEGLGPEALL